MIKKLNWKKKLTYFSKKYENLSHETEKWPWDWNTKKKPWVFLNQCSWSRVFLDQCSWSRVSTNNLCNIHIWYSPSKNCLINIFAIQCYTMYIRYHICLYIINIISYTKNLVSTLYNKCLYIISYHIQYHVTKSTWMCSRWVPQRDPNWPWTEWSRTDRSMYCTHWSGNTVGISKSNTVSLG